MRGCWQVGHLVGRLYGAWEKEVVQLCQMASNEGGGGLG